MHQEALVGKKKKIGHLCMVSKQSWNTLLVNLLLATMNTYEGGERFLPFRTRFRLSKPTISSSVETRSLVTYAFDAFDSSFRGVNKLREVNR